MNKKNQSEFTLRTSFYTWNKDDDDKYGICDKWGGIYNNPVYKNLIQEAKLCYPIKSLSLILTLYIKNKSHFHTYLFFKPHTKLGNESYYCGIFIQNRIYYYFIVLHTENIIILRSTVQKHNYDTKILLNKSNPLYIDK